MHIPHVHKSLFSLAQVLIWNPRVLIWNPHDPSFILTQPQFIAYLTHSVPEIPLPPTNSNCNLTWVLAQND